MQNANPGNPVNRAGGEAANATWPGWLGVIGGIWLIIAPFILNYSSYPTPLYNDIIVGVIAIILTGFCSLTYNQASTSQARMVAGWLAALAGLWLIIAPFVLGYSNVSNALWNDIITGVVFIVVALYAVNYHRTHFSHNY